MPVLVSEVHAYIVLGYRHHSGILAARRHLPVLLDNSLVFFLAALGSLVLLVDLFVFFTIAFWLNSASTNPPLTC